MTRIVLPWPARALSPNARPSRRRKAVAAARDKTAAYYLAFSEIHEVPAERPLRVKVTFHPPNNRWDDDNMIASFKAMRDGIAAAIKVDDGHWKTTYAVGEPVEGGKVVVRL